VDFCHLFGIWEIKAPSKSTPEEFEDGGFTLKTHQKFSVHTTLKKLKTQQSSRSVILDVMLSKTRAKKNHDYRNGGRFLKAPFSKRFPSTPKGKAGVFKFLRFEERFREAPFS